ncbi:MAG TPA: LLM class flavin-dependent oxidoreductase, partial [Methylomirabilota bacterium]|nr:LLM class flavin-dependent oxidoreductase [Methylomirabilota bacterium]
MKFGTSLSLKPPAEQFDLVRCVEALGFDSVWTGDHVSFHGPIHESLTLLATYVPITSRIRLGTAVYLLALRSAAIAAKATATLDALSGGRLIFGVGVGGENPKEFELCGVPHRERGARVTEAIDVVRTLWRDTPASFDGRFTRFDA